MTNFEKSWDALSKSCPHSIHADTALWAKWMRSEGYELLLHGDVLHARIVSEIIETAAQ